MNVACVVVAVDGSPEGLRAVDWATDDASRRGVALRVVHASVWERFEQRTLDDHELLPERKAVEAVLDSAVDRAVSRDPDVTVEAELLAEEPVPALLALQRYSPLLVLGTRGHGGFPELLLGSVSLRVAAQAPYPVVVVRGEPQLHMRAGRRVVLGVGLHDTSAAAEFAVQEAVTAGADLDLVHVWHPDHDMAGTSVLMGTGAAPLLAQDLVDAVPLLGTADAGIEVRRTALRGRPAVALLQAAVGADLIVLGARHRHHHPGLQLGSVNHAVLHHAPCPVAVVPAL